MLLVEDDPTHALLIRGRLRNLGSEIEHASTSAAAMRALDSRPFDLVVLDAGLPDGSGFDIQKRILERGDAPRIVFVTSDDLAEHAVEALRAGASHYVVKRPNYLEQMAEAVCEALGAPGIVDMPRHPSDLSDPFDDMVGESAAIARARRLIHEYGPSESAVLVSGETGTGKELVARALHRASPRASAAFVAVSCAAISPMLFESEVFGSVRGAYTGAVQNREGLVGAARGGTLFLDEVGELPPESQAKLLRLLETGTYRPVGAAREEAADVRVVTATNRVLHRAVQDGDFRLDLYYRLNVLRIHLAPLRERRGDIPALVDRFIERFGGREGCRPSEGALAGLMSQDWPGNVRELAHAVERTLALGGDAVIEHFDLGADCQAAASEIEATGVPERFAELLMRHGGRLDAVSRELGVSVRTVQRRLKKLNLRVRDFRNGDG